MIKDKNQSNEAEEKSQSSDDLRKSFRKHITSNTSNPPDDIPPFTTGEGDDVGGDSSSDSESSGSQSSGEKEP